MIRGLAVLVTCTAGIACGEDSEPKQAQSGDIAQIAKAQRQNKGPLLNGAEVRAAGDTPAATVLRWWRSIQFSAPAPELLELYASQGKPSAKGLEKQLSPIRYYFAERKPLISDQQVDKSRARVYTLVSKRSSTKGAEPAVFVLTRGSNGWQLSNNDFVSRKYSREAAFRPNKTPSNPQTTPGQ